jgi:plastocyanin
VSVGDTVEWTNHDIVVHTATANDRSWEVVIPAGATMARAIDKAGSIGYFCRFHPNMHGEINAKQ